MMKTKSLFVKVIISVAILSLGIIIGKYLPLIKIEKPKIKQYEYLGKINTGSKAPIKPLPYDISNDNAVNKSGVVTNAATAYKISNAVFIRAFGKDKINYDKPFIMTESVSALQTRGNYIMPSDTIYKAPKEWWLPYTDPSFMCSAYDNMHASWSSTHEQTWDVVKNNPFVSGQFIWTGWDYIGEPTPYGFPARSSYFGIIDLAGFPKDIYYMYQSEWTSKPILHLFPHWNWLPGQTIDMWCYYNNADEVELFVNNVSQGVRRKQPHEYHVMWRVKFEPGEVRVVAKKNGNIVREQTIRTAGTPDHIRLTADRSSNTHGGLIFVTAEIVDKDGNLCPWADNQIFFNVDGEASIAGVDNGSQTSMERFKANNRKAFFGRCLVVLKTSDTSGKIELTGRAIDLKNGHLRINNISY